MRNLAAPFSVRRTRCERRFERIVTAFHPAARFQIVEKQHEGRFLDVRDLTQLPLAHLALVGERAEHGQLPAMQPAAGDGLLHAFIKPVLGQMQQEADAGQ